MSGNGLYWRRFDLLPIAVLALVAVLMLGFRVGTGIQAAGVPDYPPVYAADNTPQGGNCCAVVQGGCGYVAGAPAALGPGTPRQGTLDPAALEQAARDIYRQQTGDSGPVEVRLLDFGCHLQADIYRDAKRVTSYSFRGGEWQEIYY